MFRALCLLALLLFAGIAVGKDEPAKPMRILFVGNSLTYVNNLPAMFTALAASQGRPVEAAMLVRGGETLSEHVASGVLSPQLLANYDKVVLQERGGDLLCADFPAEFYERCRQSRESYATLVKAIRAAGADPILLGTSQPQPEASRQLEENERDLGHELGIHAVVVSEAVRSGMQARPGADWVAPDLHPGEEQSMLVTIELYRAIFGALPQARDVVVKGEDYAAAAHFSGLEVLPEPRTKATRDFPSARIATLLSGIDQAGAAP